MKALVAVVLVIVSGALTAVMGAWLWNMVLPDVFGAQRIGFVDAFGIALVVDFFTYQPKGKRDDRSIGETYKDALTESVSLKLMFLVLGLTYWWLS